MESQDNEGEVISFTSLDHKEDGDAYEANGTYFEMFNKLKSLPKESLPYFIEFYSKTQNFDNFLVTLYIPVIKLN